MSNPPGQRERKKAETRLKISNVATQLFIERGFEQVSIDEIARVAEVARKTVFNYFPRKEDLVFDRTDESLELVREALAARAGEPPVRAVQALLRRLLAQRHPLLRIGQRPLRFWHSVAASPALTTRARELQVILADALAAQLAEAAGRPQTDSEARLAAVLLIGTLVVAYAAALRAARAKRSPEPVLLGLMERGFAGVDAALAGSPYV